MESNQITQEELKKYFDDVSNESGNIDPRQMINFNEETFGSPDEEITSYIHLLKNFNPTDMSYHKISDFYIISICSGNVVLFVYFDPASKEIHLFPQKYIITFPDANVQEELTVIKSGYIFKDEEGIRREEVFVTAGKCGFLYLFKFSKTEKAFKLYKYESHFNKINDLCFAPADLNPMLRNLLICCSDDGSMMIWNIYIECPIICIKPNKLPLDDILSVDWEYPGDKIISAHLDAVRIWTVNEEMMEVIQASHELKKRAKHFDRKDFHCVEAKIRNFHDFFIDSVKMFPNNCIATKSVDGTIMVWTYQQFSPKEWHVVSFNKYMAQSSMFDKGIYKRSYYKISYNAYDCLIVAGTDKGKIRVYNPAYSNSLAFKIFKLSPQDGSDKSSQDLSIIKAFIAEPDLDYIFAITGDGKLWYHKIQELDHNEDIEM